MNKIHYDRMKILVIEDEDFTRNLICRLLREVGVRFIGECGNGKDGLMELVRARPHLVFCDVHMEPMNGLQFLKGVRNIKVKGVDHTAIVFLTADSNTDTVIFAKEHGVAGYLVKPVSLKQMRDRIDFVVTNTPLLAAELMEP
jgi:two-component system, chemotaxis family, chemotaxis protein CheY